MIKAPRGTRDILPPDSSLFQFVEEKAREVFRLYNFQEIRTPIFESTELFARGVGEETDIVSKEMFTWEDKAKLQLLSAAGEEVVREVQSGSARTPQSLTLRPENTAGVVRAYIEHKLGDTGLLQKLYYMGPQFRRERPQKGRYRQFYQIGAEVIGPPSAGSESPARDAEVIVMLADLLNQVGIQQWKLELNSIGSAEDRARYNAALREALAGVKDKMCADCQRRAETNPLRVLDCKVPEDQPIIDSLPKITAHLGDDARKNFAEVQQLLTACNVSFTINERMVRGLDYYQKVIFEFTHGGLGAQSALLGGGRYDGLSEMLGGPRAPGIGFALGLDRFVLALESEIASGAAQKKIAAGAQVYIAPLGAGMNVEAAKLAHELRQQGLALEVGDETFRLKKSFETAEKLGCTFVVIVGENEVKSGSFAVKNIQSGEQVSVARGELKQHLATNT